MSEALFCKKCEREMWHCDCKSPGTSNSLQTPCYADDFDLGHPSTVVVAESEEELVYIQNWCEINNTPPPFMGRKKHFPCALSINGGGWTDNMDRALYYVRFVDFATVA